MTPRRALHLLSVVALIAATLVLAFPPLQPEPAGALTLSPGQGYATRDSGMTEIGTGTHTLATSSDGAGWVVENPGWVRLQGPGMITFVAGSDSSSFNDLRLAVFSCGDLASIDDWACSFHKELQQGSAPTVPPTSADGWTVLGFGSRSGKDVQGTGQVTIQNNPPDAPGAPTVTPQHRRAVMSWSAPNAHGVGINRYEVDVERWDGSVWVSHLAQVDVGNTTSYEVASLVNGTRYQFRVRAISDLGVGAWSGWTEATPVGASSTHSIAADPAAPTRTDTFTLSAAVGWAETDTSDPQPSGTVTFTDTAPDPDVVLAADVAVVNGVATTGDLGPFGAGDLAVTAAFTPEDDGATVSSGTATVSVAKSSQTVAFDPLGDRTWDPSDTTFGVSASASSGLEVGFSASGVCTVADTGVSTGEVTVTGAGSCTITASQPGDADWAAASVERSFTVHKAANAISWTVEPPGSPTYGDAPFEVTVAASSGELVALTPSGDPPCSVGAASHGSGATSYTVTLTGGGECTLTASQGETSDYAAATDVARTFTVGARAQSITWDEALPARTFGDASFDLVATASSGLGVTFSSTDANVCTVAGATVSITGGGTCELTASQAGDTDWAAASDVVRSFAVATAAQAITWDQALVDLALHETPAALSASAGSGLAVAFASSTPSVCTVAGTTVSLVGTGTCTIAATQPGDHRYAAATPVARSFAVSTGTPTLEEPTNYTPPAPGFDETTVDLDGELTVVPADRPVVYESSTPGVCTVSGSVVTFVSAGECRVSASMPADGDWEAAGPVEIVMQVAKGDQTITLSDWSAPYAPSGIDPGATASSGLAVTYTAGAPCSIGGDGLVVAGDAGTTCSVTAHQAGDDDWNAAPQVVRTLTVTKAAQLIDAPAVGDQVLGSGPVAFAPTAPSGETVQVAVTDETVCTWATGEITLVAVGTCELTLTEPTGSVNYDAAPPLVVAFEVTAAPPPPPPPTTTTTSTTAPEDPTPTTQPGGGIVPDVPQPLPPDVPPEAAEEGTPQGAVHRMYLTLFGRVADPGGADYWVGQHHQGTPLATIVLGFIRSPEWQVRHGNPTGATLVRKLYLNVLGREPEPSGYTYWVGMLDRGEIDEEQMVLFFTNSPELLARLRALGDL